MAEIEEKIRFRLTRVYLVSLVVLLDYLLLKGLAPFRGPGSRKRALRGFQMRSARRATHLIQRVRGLFIKIGQMISILTNFLPATFREEMAAVQDRVRPSPFARVKARIESDLGGSIEERYAHLEEEPLAAASLAQVHRARLHDGREVVVKVLHPDIENKARRDLRTLNHLVIVGGWIAGIRGLDRVHKQVTAMIAEELDFAGEARNLVELSACFADEPRVVFPELIETHSATRVLTTTFQAGIKITDRDALQQAGVDQAELARRLLHAYCTMIFKHGRYHADPHPGNLLVRPDGTLIFLDFGAVSQLSENMRTGITRFIQAIIAGQPDQVHGAMDTMGFIARGEEDISTRIVAYFQTKFLEQVNLESFRVEDITADFQTKLDMIADFRQMGIPMSEVTAAFQIPKEWVLLQPYLIVVVGFGNPFGSGPKPHDRDSPLPRGPAGR